MKHYRFWTAWSRSYKKPSTELSEFSTIAWKVSNRIMLWYRYIFIRKYFLFLFSLNYFKGFFSYVDFEYSVHIIRGPWISKNILRSKYVSSHADGIFRYRVEGRYTIAFIQKHISNNIDIEDTFYTPSYVHIKKCLHTYIHTYT